MNPTAPVAHVSYFEADAYATWAVSGLPTKSEWEVATRGLDLDGQLPRYDSTATKTSNAAAAGLQQMIGDRLGADAQPSLPMRASGCGRRRWRIQRKTRCQGSSSCEEVLALRRQATSE